MKSVMQYIVAWLFILPCILLDKGALSIACEGLQSCDCRRERDWLQDGSDSYGVIECEGDMDMTSFNFSWYSKKTDLQEIIFTNTSIRSIGKNVFNGMKQIKTLKIQNQTIKIHADAFAPLGDNLEHVSLININISRDWKLDYLKHLENLETLYLDKNGQYPEHFPKHVFRNISLTSLKHLSLRYCKIAIMTREGLEGLPNLEVLDLSHNYLPTVPDAIIQLRKLRKLNLSFNKRLIYVHDYAFKPLKYLEEIDISNTDLSTISEFAFYGLENSLTNLHLHHALLQDGHFHSMKELKRLKFIDISYNRIVEIHNTSFEGFVALDELDISGQSDIKDGVPYKLGFIDSVFKGVERKLKILHIRDLGMDSSLPLGALKSLQRLETLDASMNKFTEIYEEFFYGIKAKNIYLTDMEISSISNFAFENLRPGVSIYFDRNNVTNISFVLDTPICLFKKLSLTGNPITCECDVIEIAATNRVSDIVGTCADNFYRGENIKTIHEMDIAKVNCDTKGYKKITHCSYINSAACTLINLYLCVTYTMFSMFYLFL
ncbi:chaoptin-like [Ruditapes philippinarum]|uniref:chaoptin-like n=1 Tax=Ruditapes philippinarum TaxID=129788 RepID=UPI00295BAA77|nr:chaoptin-like [Ruditapes philippinarum]